MGSGSHSEYNVNIRCWGGGARLLPKQNLVAALVAQDLAQRNLQMNQATLALAALQSRQRCVCRVIEYHCLKRALYLFYFAKSKKYIAEHTSMQKLMDKATSILLSTCVDDYFDHGCRRFLSKIGSFVSKLRNWKF